MIAAMRITHKRLSDNTILFQGAGEVSLLSMDNTALNLWETCTMYVVVKSRSLKFCGYSEAKSSELMEYLLSY